MAVWYRLLIILVVVSSEKRKFQLKFDAVNIKHWDLLEELKYTLSKVNNRSSKIKIQLYFSKFNKAFEIKDVLLVF